MTFKVKIREAKKTDIPILAQHNQALANETENIELSTKTILPGGVLYMEKGSFTYAFYDQEAQANIHDGIAQNRTINAHAYRIVFENINSNI